MTKKLPNEVQIFIDKYFKLPLNGKNVPCPYYINIKKIKQRMGLRVLIGKGTPEEIIQESLIYEKLRGVDFSQMTVNEIKEFLIKRHIGIDCSGFVTHILDKWLIINGKKHIWKYLKWPKQNLYRIIARNFRPVENITAEMLTSDLNTIQIKNINNIKCGDLIRSRTPRRSNNLKYGNHVILISEINKTNGKVNSFEYVHSTCKYEDKHGVRRGKVIITKFNEPIYKQKWTDIYKGKNYTLKDLQSDKDYSQIRRLKNVPLL